MQEGPPTQEGPRQTWVGKIYVWFTRDGLPKASIKFDDIFSNINGCNKNYVNFNVWGHIGDKEKNTNITFFYLKSLSPSSYITKPWHVRHQRLFFPWWKLVEEVSNFGGLALTHQAIESGHVLIQKSMQRRPDLSSRCRAIMQSPTPDKVQRGGSHRSISDWKQLPGSGEHLIICDAKQLKTRHLLTYRTNMAHDILLLLNIISSDTMLSDDMF